MENAAFTSHEVIEMDLQQTKTTLTPQYNTCTSATRPSTDTWIAAKDGNGKAHNYCDVSKCCTTNQPNKNESSWHSTKSTLLLVFLVGFLVWAVCYFGIFRSSMV